MKENKIKGVILMYEPNCIKKIELEAEIEISYLEVSRQKFYAFFWANTKCPYDDEKINFDIIFKDFDKSNIETAPAGDCIHFFPSKFLSDEEIDSMKMREEFIEVEMGLMYVDMTIKEFAEKMGWEVEWHENAGNKYPVFVEHKENGEKNEKN